MKMRLKKCVPPGIPAKKEIQFYGIGNAAAFLVSCSFLSRYRDAYGQLFNFRHGGKVLRPDAMMQPFGTLIRGSFLGFLVIAVCLLGLIAFHYHSYRHESMSIYLMRRLPDRKLLRRQCLTLPLLGLALSALFALILLGIYYAVYLLRTPAVCLPAEIWRGFL